MIGAAPSPAPSRRVKFLLVVVFLVVCVASLQVMPVLTPWGADLQNLQAYARCASGGRSPYEIAGRACGDHWGRPFFYPPFLLACFRWTRPLTLAGAMYVWTAFLFAAFAGIFWVWAKKIARAPAPPGERHQVVIFCALLLLQFPFVFALERGNTDTVNVLLYSLAALLLVRRRSWWAGVAAGVAAGFKLSPVVAVVVMTGALLLARARAGAWTWLRFSGGALAAFALTLLVFFRDSRTYLFTVLPKYAGTLTPLNAWNHATPSFVGGDYPRFALLLCLGLLAVWVWAGARAIERGDDGLALAGSLAVSTFVQRTSFDYNLITVYPLLLLLFLRAQATNRFALLAFGLFAIAGDRRLFTSPGAVLLTPHLHLTVELAFLVVAALVIARPDGAEPPGGGAPRAASMGVDAG
ncbi:MAG TPA: glycosyltransferase 87 family protein [Polyangia bacterium]|jgi:alpha-1,2-mannosyltransferase